MGSKSKKLNPTVVTEAPRVIITTLDEHLFRGNGLATKLFRYFLIMGLLMVILGPALDLVFGLLKITFLFQHLSHSTMVILLLLGFAVYSSYKILKPLKSLLADVRKIHGGDLDVELDQKGYDEIESLAKSVNRLRNSLAIATEMLGKRDKSMDKQAVEKISGLSTTFALIIPFLIYGLLLLFFSGIIYSPLFENPMNGTVPLYGLFQAIGVIIVGIGLAFAFGYVVSFVIGNPIRKLAIDAEKVSQGDMDVDFKVLSWGDLAELSVSFSDMKKAIQRAYDELMELEEEG